MVERGEKAHIPCPECGRRVPATVYCIYCGAKLPPRTAPPRAPPVPPLTPAEPPSPPPPPLSVPTEVKGDVRELMAGISLHYTRKVALLDLLQSKAVSERIFLKLYDEYTNKLQDSMGLRARVMDRLRSELDGRKKRYGEVKTFMEELEVRHKIGEISSDGFNRRAEALRSEVTGLENAISGLRDDLDHLERLFIDKTPKEIFDLETRARACYESLDRLVEEKVLTGETQEKVKPDVESMLDLLDTLIADRKKKEKALREELETLETRYRVGEVPIEQYETRKRELQSQLEKVWA